MTSKHVLLRFFVSAAISVLALLQSQRAYAQNAIEEARLDTQTNGSQTVNVKEYGAVGDGATNDTAAFIKALAACAVKGGTCLVPEGTYLISASGISTG
ncbi:MAG: hypothetical protein DME65_14585, partial [Verrucomicrobia bacterium]